MNQDLRNAAAVLAEAALEIFAGSYKNVDRIFKLTDETRHAPEIASLAEAFGRMAVKVEAREYALEQTINELQEKNTTIENLNRVNSQLTYIFLGIVFVLTFYTFALGLLQSDIVSSLAIGEQVRSWTSRVMEVLSLLMIIWLILKTGLPLSEFGVTLKNWRSILNRNFRKLKESRKLNIIHMKIWIMMIRVLMNYVKKSLIVFTVKNMILILQMRLKIMTLKICPNVSVNA